MSCGLVFAWSDFFIYFFKFLPIQDWNILKNQLQIYLKTSKVSCGWNPRCYGSAEGSFKLKQLNYAKKNDNFCNSFLRRA